MDGWFVAAQLEQWGKQHRRLCVSHIINSMYCSTGCVFGKKSQLFPWNETISSWHVMQFPHRMLIFSVDLTGMPLRLSTVRFEARACPPSAYYNTGILVFVGGRHVMEAGRMLTMTSHNDHCWQQLMILVDMLGQYTQIWVWAFILEIPWWAEWPDSTWSWGRDPGTIHQCFTDTGQTVADIPIWVSLKG